MSKTDKTTPWKIRLKVDSSIRVEVHNHGNGICEIEEQLPKFYNYHYCGYRFLSKYRYTSGIYGRPKSEQVYRKKANRKERTRIRMAFSDMLKMSREDLENSYEFQNFPNRHSALWEAF